MGKHHKHNKDYRNPLPDNREMYQCEVCKKRFPFEGYIPHAHWKPFMFLVIGDPKDRRFSLAVCTGPEMQMTKTEEPLWFTCSDRNCIYKSFLMWREWDRRKNADAVAMEQMRQADAALIEQVGQMLDMVKGKSAAELDEILRHGIVQQGKSGGSRNAPDEAMPTEAVPAKQAKGDSP